MDDEITPCTDCPDEDEFAAGTVTADDETEPDETPDPRGRKVTRWRGLVAPIGKPTGDGRRFAAGALTNREVPHALRWQRSDEGGHKSAVVIGTTDRYEYTPDGVYAEGTMFDPDPAQLPRLAEDVAEAKLLLQNKAIGPSVDLDSMEFHALPQEEGDFADDGGQIQKRPEIEVDKGRISASTLVPIPAFAEARPFELYEVDADQYAAALPFLVSSVQVDGWSDLPMADAATDWNPAEAAERLMEFAADNLDAYGLGFLWHDPDNLGSRDAYRFPIADVIDGQLAIVPAAITAAGARLDAAALPEQDKAVMRAVLAAIETGETSPMLDLLTTSDAEFLDLGFAVRDMDEDDFAELADLAEDYVQAINVGEEVVDGATFGARFDKLVSKLSGHVADAKAVAAKIGRKKYGKKGMVALQQGAKAADVKPLTASGFDVFLSAMVAAGAPAQAPERPSREVFEMPEADRPTPLTVTPDGRVFGHVADWSTCHTGIAGQCVRAPKSKTNYAYFHTGSVLTAEGAEIPVGRLSVGGGHADTSLGLRAAVAHYDDASTAVVEGRAKDGKHGIWFSGRVIPEYRNTPMEDAVRRHPPSGDWRRVGGNLEMVHVLAVNSPGFPVPRVALSASAASGAGEELVPAALVAAGVVATPEQAQLAASASGPAGVDVQALVRQAVVEYRTQEEAAQRRTRAATLLAEMDEAVTASGSLARRQQALAAAALID